MITRLLNFLFKNEVKEIVLSENPNAGYKTVYNGFSVRKVITNEVLFKKFLMELHSSVTKDFEGK